VGEDTITIAAVDSECVAVVRERSMSEPEWKIPQPKLLKAYRARSLSTLITHTIVMQEAKKRNLAADSVSVKRIYDSLMTDEFQTREGFLKRLEKDKETEEEFTKNLPYKIAEGRLKYILLEPFLTPEDTLKAYYEKKLDLFKTRSMIVSHICLYKKLDFAYKPKKQLKLTEEILKVKDSTLKGESLQKAMTEAADKDRKKIQEIYKKLKTGSKFEDLAREFSEDTITAKRGGYNKRIPWGYLYAPYCDSAFSLKKGQCSGPFETPFGFYIVRAESNPELTITPYEEAKNNLRGKFDKGKRDKVFREFLKKRWPRILMDTSAVPTHLKF
jgi:parvulin-like peptidyl-prolyl isomerase